MCFKIILYGVNMKISKFLFKILLIGLALVVIYFLYPKYQINTVKIDDNQVLITRVNTLTGQITTQVDRFKIYHTGN